MGGAVVRRWIVLFRGIVRGFVDTVSITYLMHSRFKSQLVDSPWLAGGGLGAVVVVGSLTASETDDGFYLCLFRRCSGGYCPGCGITRSIGRLLRADPAGAWHHHPWVILALAQVMVAAVAWTVAREQTRRMSDHWIVRLAVFNAALLLAIWAARLGQGSIPRPFG